MNINHYLKNHSEILFFNFENLVTNLRTFSHSNGPLAPGMLILYISSTGYSSNRANKTIVSVAVVVFLKKHRNYYKPEMMILLLKPMGCNCSKDVPHFGFYIFSVSFRKNMGPNELKNFTVLVETKHIFILSVQLFSKDILLEYVKSLFLIHSKKSSP